ncbi:MAG: PilZ domain-containing protein, partial [Pseudomonadota bacterium]
MQKRPILLIFAASVFLLSPVGLFYRNFQGEPVSVTDWFLSGILPLVLCIGLLRVNRIAWYTVFGFVFLWGVRELQGLQFLIYIISLTYFINPRIKRLYFDPKLQWWRTKKRYETHGPAIVQIKTKTLYPTLKNISEGGCFLETPHSQEEGETLTIMIPLPSPLPDS